MADSRLLRATCGTLRSCPMLSLNRITKNCDLCPQESMAIQVYACDSCIFGRKTPGHAIGSAIQFRPCEICLQQKVSRVAWFHSDTCVACQYNFRKSFCDEKMLFLQQLNLSPLNDNFTGDVSILVEDSDQPIQAHRFILASKSAEFNNMKEKLSGTIQIAGFSAVVVRVAVNFMYTGEIKFGDQVLSQDVFRFAHKYKIRWLKDVCVADLVENLNAKNVMEILSISWQFRVEMLQREVKKFFDDHPDFAVNMNFMFMGKMKFGEQVLSQDVLGFAHRYQIPWLKDLSETDLVKNLNVENVMEMMLVSSQFEAELLKREVRKFFTHQPDVHSTILDNLSATLDS